MYTCTMIIVISIVTTFRFMIYFGSWRIRYAVCRFYNNFHRDFRKQTLLIYWLLDGISGLQSKRRSLPWAKTIKYISRRKSVRSFCSFESKVYGWSKPEVSTRCGNRVHPNAATDMHGTVLGTRWSSSVLRPLHSRVLCRHRWKLYTLISSRNIRIERAYVCMYTSLVFLYQCVSLARVILHTARLVHKTIRTFVDYTPSRFDLHPSFRI